MPARVRTPARPHHEVVAAPPFVRPHHEVAPVSPFVRPSYTLPHMPWWDWPKRIPHGILLSARLSLYFSYRLRKLAYAGSNEKKPGVAT